MNLHLKKHWRIWMLALFVTISTLVIFGPAAGLVGDADPAENATDDVEQPTASQYTNLQFGLELSGGTQVRAPLVGMTAENLEFEREEAGEIELTLMEELGVESRDVSANADSGTVELFTDEYVGNVTRSEFEAALAEAGLSGSVRMGVTGETRDGVEEVLQSRLTQHGLGGGQATQVAAPGQQFILVEVPGADRNEVIELIGERGTVEIVALFIDDDGEMHYEVLLDQDEFTPGQANMEEGRPGVPITVDPQAAQEFQSAMQEYGYDRQGGVRCGFDENQTVEYNVENNLADDDRCLMTVLDDEVVHAAGITSGLSDSFRTGVWADRGTYRSQTSTLEEANALEIHMREGALRTTLDIDNRGTSFFLQPSLAQEFKPLSLLTGGAAILAVAFVVFLRYRKPQVAAPMLLTAGAEVYILLGFAALVGLPLDLSHIAGFIAVIGTGVDDLVIIADEIMQQGEVRTSRVFESRFRKAFWVIGAAAATTIIAMSPLAVLSLGDLRGFAIVTIVGVLIGVLVTRPAYGDILRILVLEDAGED